jgi:hypothetical protein
MIVIVVRANSALSCLAALLLLEKGLPVDTTTILRF